MSFILSPSILSADFANLGKDIGLLDKSEAEWVHIDVMDGNFVPNISFGLPVIEKIRPLTSKPFDVHLMISHPENFVKDFKKAGADILTVHYETSLHLHRLTEQIKENDMKVGIALNPHTSPEVIRPIANYLDLVLVMSVNPGFGGQKFIPESLDKIQALSHIKHELNAGFTIEVDGGVKTDNAARLLQAGAEALVAGSAVFKGDIQQNITDFKNLKTGSIT